MGIPALTQYPFRRDLIEPQALGEKVVFAHAGDRLEVALAQAQQADVAFQDSGVGDGIRAGNRRGMRSNSHSRPLMQCHADQSQTGVSGTIRLCLFYDEWPHHFTDWVS
jgi:hypothetical protein